MNKELHPKISSAQYILLITGAQVWFGVLTLPRDLSVLSGTDGWISLLIGWGAAVASSLFILLIVRHHPEQTLMELLNQYFGRWLGKGISLCFMLYFFSGALCVGFKTIHLFQLFALPHMANYAIMALYLIPLYLVVRNGLNVVGRYNQLLLYIVLWMPFVMLFALRQGQTHWLNFLPLLHEGWHRIFSGVWPAVNNMLGFELILILYPFLENKKHAVRNTIAANTISLLIYLFFVGVCFLYFSPDGITDYKWPPIILLKSIEFSFVERFEIVFLPFFLFLFYTKAIPYLFMSVFSLTRVLNLRDHRPILLVFVLVMFIMSIFYNPSYDQIKFFINAWGKSGLLFAYLFPVLFCIYIGLFKLFKGGPGK